MSFLLVIVLAIRYKLSFLFLDVTGRLLAFYILKKCGVGVVLSMNSVMKMVLMGGCLSVISACATLPDTTETRQQLAEDIAQLVLIHGGYELIQEQVTVRSTYNLIDQVESITGRPVDNDYSNAYRISFQAAFEKSFPMEGWVLPVAAFYSTQFNSAELEELLKLYRKPVGQKILKTDLRLARESTEFGHTAVKEKASEYIQVFNVEVKHNQP